MAALNHPDHNLSTKIFTNLLRSLKETAKIRGMSTKLRDLIYLLFDRCNEGEGQFLYGTWFKPKSDDSLRRLLEELGEGSPRPTDPDPSFL